MEVIVFKTLIHYTLLFPDHPTNPYTGSWGNLLCENPLKHRLENPYTRTCDIFCDHPFKKPHTVSWGNPFGESSRESIRESSYQILGEPFLLRTF